MSQVWSSQSSLAVRFTISEGGLVWSAFFNQHRLFFCHLFQFEHWRVNRFSAVTFEGRYDHVKHLSSIMGTLVEIKIKRFVEIHIKLSFILVDNKVHLLSHSHLSWLIIPRSLGSFQNQFPPSTCSASTFYRSWSVCWSRSPFSKLSLQLLQLCHRLSDFLFGGLGNKLGQLYFTQEWWSDKYRSRDDFN